MSLKLLHFHDLSHVVHESGKKTEMWVLKSLILKKQMSIQSAMEIQFIEKQILFKNRERPWWRKGKMNFKTALTHRSIRWIHLQNEMNNFFTTFPMIHPIDKLWKMSGERRLLNYVPPYVPPNVSLRICLVHGSQIRLSNRRTQEILLSYCNRHFQISMNYFLFL